MGVGKTAVSQELKKRLPNSVFLDGDWCWDADPFTVTEETKAMVLENIVFLLNQYIQCSAYENIIFCWVMHHQDIIDDLLSRINTKGCLVHTVSLLCSPETLAVRLGKDVVAGIRQPDVIKRSIERIPLYAMLDTLKIRTDGMTIEEVAERIMVMSGTL